MDGLAEFFDHLKKKALTRGHMLGFLHTLIARQISKTDGTVISSGLGWRQVADWLKKTRWDIEDVRELGLDPESLPPRDRQRFWFQVIGLAGIDSVAAKEAGDRFAEVLRASGYVVGP